MSALHGTKPFNINMIEIFNGLHSNSRLWVYAIIDHLNSITIRPIMMTKKSLIQSPEAIEKMRVAGKLASDVLVMLDEHVRVGISTEALNQIAEILY